MTLITSNLKIDLARESNLEAESNLDNMLPSNTEVQENDVGRIQTKINIIVVFHYYCFVW